MDENVARPVVAVYSHTFLTISMTFVYRQLTGVSEWFQPIVLTNRVENGTVFPFSPVYESPDKWGLRQRLAGRLHRTFRRRSYFTTRKQFNHWLEACKSNHVSLIHAHFGYGGLRMLPLAERLGIPLLVTFHGDDASAFLSNRLYVRNVRHLLSKAYILCVSQSMRLRLSTLEPAPHMLPAHYIGIPVAEFPFVDRRPVYEKKQAGERIQFLQIANLLEKKGHQYALRAFRDFLIHYGNAHLALAGEGELRKPLEELTSELGITDNVTFVGKVSGTDVDRLMRDADIFLHHSVTGANGSQEGIPTVIMEAMSTGLTVISTFHSGIPELVEDGIDGFLVPECDVPSFKAKMIEATETRKEMGVRANSKIQKHFNLSLQNERLATIYAKIVDEARVTE